MRNENKNNIGTIEYLKGDSLELSNPQLALDNLSDAEQKLASHLVLSFYKVFN